MQPRQAQHARRHLIRDCVHPQCKRSSLAGLGSYHAGQAKRNALRILDLVNARHEAFCFRAAYFEPGTSSIAATTSVFSCMSASFHPKLTRACRMLVHCNCGLYWSGWTSSLSAALAPTRDSRHRSEELESVNEKRDDNIGTDMQCKRSTRINCS